MLISLNLVKVEILLKIWDGDLFLDEESHKPYS